MIAVVARNMWFKNLRSDDAWIQRRMIITPVSSSTSTANLIAWPIAYYAMNRWLQDFAYRIDIGWWVFALAGGLALVIALLTVCTQAIKAALANPVEALRYE